MTKLIYAYRRANEKKYHNISGYISKHVSGRQKLNSLPLQIQLSIGGIKGDNELITDEDDEIIKIARGDYIAIYYDDYSFCLGDFRIEDAGPEIISWNNDEETWNLIYNVRAVIPMFSSGIIENFSYTDTNFSVIAEQILSYSDGSIDSIVLEFDDYSISSFNLSKIEAHRAFTELADQTYSYWKIDHDVVYNSTNNISITRYIRFANESGFRSDSQVWEIAINNAMILIGTITNPVIANRANIPLVPGDTKVSYSDDPSLIINFLELEANIYVNNDNSTNSVQSIEATISNQYELKQQAGAINYVFKYAKTPVKVLGGSSSSSVYVQSNLAKDVSAGDYISFPDRSETAIYEIDTITEVDDDYSTIEPVDTLAFTPTTGETIKLLKLIPIYSDNEIAASGADINIGVNVSLDKSNPAARLEFRSLSAPPPGAMIDIHFTPVQPLILRNKNQDSINIYGQKYKRQSVPEDIIFTEAELNTYLQNLMVLDPLEKLIVYSFRPELAKLGTMLSVDITDVTTNNFMILEQDFQFVAYDENENPLWKQTLNLSNLVQSFEAKFAKLEKNLKPVKAASLIEKLFYKEVTKIIESFTYTKSTVNVNAKDFDISSFTDGVYYNFQTGSGTVLYDQLGATTTNANLGDSSLWTTGYQGYYGYGGIDSLAKRILIPSSPTYTDSGNTRGFVYLFRTGSDVSGTRFLSSKDSTILGAEHQIGFNASGQLDVLIYGGSGTFVQWRSTDISLLSTNSTYLATISIDLVTNTLTVTLNGSVLSGSVYGGSISGMPSLRTGGANMYIGLLYQEGSGFTTGISDFTFYRLLFTTDTISSAWAATEATRFGL